MFERKLTPIITELLAEFRIVYLTGPRQAGKTTLTKIIAQNNGLEYISFDNQTILQSAQNDPIGFINSLHNKKVVLDEFQYIPELIPAIKQASDNLPPNVKGKFLLTGSADIFRSGKTQEALPGHMARLELYPLSLSEQYKTDYNIVDLLCNENFNLNNLTLLTRADLANFILKGGYPEIQDKSSRAKQIWYKSYIEGRLFKDFETLYHAKGDYRSKLEALIPYLAGISSNLLKYSNISNDLGEDDKLVKAYIEVLELMFIIKRVPAYLKNKAKRQAITIPKLQTIDTGLACSLLGIKNEGQLLNSPHYGGLLENLIYMELLKQNSWSEEKVELLHFRDKYQNEVDIVMERDNHQIIGVEIKASATVNIHDFKGLIKLAEFNPSKFQYGVIFYSGKEILPFSKNEIKLFALPISLFIKSDTKKDDVQ
ncbi:TPA: ATP-binding protein [Legionella pneumophila]|uniref:ATP-binding protein n=2 Tax=Legionella pneumophila TaxID=446 RepID=UPI0004857794|nr:ATP-binding protein [Legionella pneumophila]ANH13272.1 AAA family ATPase [Legionella pneumophila]ANH16238.1 AAA family ATPase [Legionella pneumophila]ANH19205.1 AAA family ATPase [Legionella pneumophila]APX20092.1 AAA family ATPase [Legionella pneumophila]AQL12269.1 AAA family ATPase [Legionella pneumophila]